MKLDVSMLRYMSKDDFRTLTAVEMGMKNHQYVAPGLITSIAGLKRGSSDSCIKALHKHKLIHHTGEVYDGYKLTYMGYDYLSLRAFAARGTCVSVGNKLGVGKESDIYYVANAEEEICAMKLQRLGRVSFRSVKNTRDYMRHRKSASWLYMSRLAALKEFAYMQVLYEAGFPVPKPMDWSRHAIIMELMKGVPMTRISRLGHISYVYQQCMDLIVRLAEHGLVHGDFNEFNLIVDPQEKVWMIDFPQMVSTDHPNAEEMFDRDVMCVRRHFEKKFRFVAEFPIFAEVQKKLVDLRAKVEGTGLAEELDEADEALITGNSPAPQKEAVSTEALEEAGGDEEVIDTTIQRDAGELSLEDVLAAPMDGGAVDVSSLRDALDATMAQDEDDHIPVPVRQLAPGETHEVVVVEDEEHVEVVVPARDIVAAPAVTRPNGEEHVDRMDVIAANPVAHVANGPSQLRNDHRNKRRKATAKKKKDRFNEDPEAVVARLRRDAKRKTAARSSAKSNNTKGKARDLRREMKER